MFLLKSFDCLNAFSSCRMAAQKIPERFFSRIFSILLLMPAVQGNEQSVGAKYAAHVRHLKHNRWTVPKPRLLTRGSTGKDKVPESSKED